MPRIKLTVAYDGTDFHGWQKQHPPGAPPLRTVQGVLERAVREVVREPVNLMGASRTDSGVHARAQVAAFTSEVRIPAARLVRAINSRLPDDVQVLRARPVRASFDPIGDAVRKGYRYRIAHGVAFDGVRPLFDRHLITAVEGVLDPARMDAAARHLVGEHDFASLTRSHHGRESTVRTIDECRVTAASRYRLRIDVSGNGFLHHMVRIIAGTLADVGSGRIEPDAIPEILAARDRSAAGPTMRPEGLCLMWVEYGGGKG
jgi:tRNA pseudouridine38-40 synthase